MAATLSVSIESVEKSEYIAAINQSNAIPKNPPIKEEIPLEEMIKLIKNPATATVHQAAEVV